MPASVVTEPLAVRFVFPDGTGWTARLDGLANPTLAADLARGLPMLTHPHGGIATRHTAGQYVQALRAMVADLAAAGFTGGAAELTRAVLVRYWLASTHLREMYSRKLLAGFDAVAGGLDPGVREHLAGRPLHVAAPTRPLQPYTEQQWDRLRDCCEQVINDGWARHTAMLAAADRGGDPRRAGPGEENLAWLMLHQGPLTFDEVAAYLGDGRDRLRRPVRTVREALFAPRATQIAHQLLFGVFTGIVADGIADLGMADVHWAGDATVLLDYVKGRAGPQGLNLPVRAVRLLHRWLQLSQPVRRFAPPRLRDQLWISVEINGSTDGSRYLGPPTKPDTMRTWGRHHGLLPEQGLRVPVHRGRIRTTYHNLLSRRGWTGRTTIDPNHTATVEGDRYLTATTPAQQDAVDAIIEQGQADLLRKALPAVVLSDEQTIELVRDHPDAVARLGLDEAGVADLVGGPRDVLLAACADQLAGMHGPAGKPCPARPWVCLLCPLAVFLPRHAPNLLRLKAFFARQFRQMTTDQFVRVFGPYAARLDTEILPRFDRRLLHAAAAVVHDGDDELPLRAEEST
jgi:hypothetical protein